MRGTVEERFWAKVQKTEGCWNWTGGKQSWGYGVFTVNAKAVRVHRLSYEMSGKQIPAGAHIDHICRNRACVNPEHLRVVTPKQNLENLDSASNNASGFRGVTKGPHGKWQGRVTHYGKSMSAGLYFTAEEAAEAVTKLRNELFTHNDADRAA